MRRVSLALGLTVLAALLNASGNLAQRAATRAEPERTGPLRLIVDLARRPVWVAGVVAGVLGLAVHVLALSLGKLTVVQPLLVLQLPFAVLGARLLFGVRLARRDWVAIALLTTGLAAFIVCLSPNGGDPLALTGAGWAAGLGSVGAVVGALVLAGARVRADQRAAVLGAAAGVAYGTTSVLFAAAGAATLRGAPAPLGVWQAYAAVAVGLMSFCLLQNSLHSGRLVATAPGLTLLNPIVAVLWGLLLFGEQARTGLWLVGSLVGAGLLVAGTLMLIRSPALQARPNTTTVPNTATRSGIDIREQPEKR